MARLLGLLTAVVGLVLVVTSPSYAQKVNTAGYKAASLPCASGVLLPVIPAGTPYISAYVACNQFVTTSSLPGLLSTPGDPITFVGFDAAGHIRTSPALGGGSVTSVGLSVPSWLQVSGTNPITVSGTFSITAASQSANLFLASPSGSSGVLAPRAITAADISGLSPTFGALTVSSCSGCGGGGSSVSITAGNAGVTVSPSPLIGTGSVSLNIVAAPVTHQWVSSITAAGVATLAQPGFADISGSVSAAQMATNLGTAVSTLCGGSTTNFVRGDGTCTTPAGGGNVNTSGSISVGAFGIWTSGTGLAGTVVPGTNVLTALANPTNATGGFVTFGSGINPTFGALTVSSCSGCGGGGSVSITAGNAGIVFSPSPLIGTGTASLNITGGSAVSNQWVNSISAAGVATLSQPGFTSISGSPSAAQMATNLSGAVSTLCSASTTNFVRGDGTCVSPGGGSLTVGTTAVASGTNYGLLFNNTGSVLGNTPVLGAGLPLFGNGAVNPPVVTGTLSGNTTKLVTQGSGSTTSGHQLVYDASGNAIDGGSPGSGGTVTSITAGNAGITLSPSTITTTGSASLNITGGSAVSNQWVNSISAAGVATLGQPAFTNLSGSASAAQMATNLGAAVSTLCSASTTNFVRGDGTCVTPSGSGNVSTSGSITNGTLSVWVTGTTISGTLATGFTGSGTFVPQANSGLFSPTVLPLATDSAIGAMKGDGATITCATTPGTCSSTAGVTDATTSTAGSGASPTAAQFNAGWVKNLDAASLTATFPAVSTLGSSGLVVISGLANAGTITATSPDTITSGAGVSGAGGSVSVGAGCAAIVSKISTGLSVSGNLCAGTGVARVDSFASTGHAFTAPSGYAQCTATCTVTPPVPAAGYQFCVYDKPGTTGVITLGGQGSVLYGKVDFSGYGSAGGTLTSGGAAGDKACIIGIDSTHYDTIASHGTWTAS